MFICSVALWKSPKMWLCTKIVLYILHTKDVLSRGCFRKKRASLHWKSIHIRRFKKYTLEIMTKISDVVDFFFSHMFHSLVQIQLKLPHDTSHISFFVTSHYVFKKIFLQFFWEIIGIHHWVGLRHTAWWNDLHIRHCRFPWKHLWHWGMVPKIYSQQSLPRYVREV